jgi:hypothetical protein
MVWSISITNEGWTQIREALTVLSFEDLCKAIADTNYEIFHGYHSVKGKPHYKGAWNYKKLMNDRIFKQDRSILENQAFEFIELFDNCDNGGYYYWIDPEGYHKVDIDDGAFSFDKDEEIISILLSPHSGHMYESSFFDHMTSLISEKDLKLVMDLERDKDIFRFTIPIKKHEALKEAIEGFHFHVDDICNLVQYRIEEAYLYLYSD